MWLQLDGSQAPLWILVRVLVRALVSMYWCVTHADHWWPRVYAGAPPTTFVDTRMIVANGWQVQHRALGCRRSSSIGARITLRAGAVLALVSDVQCNHLGACYSSRLGACLHWFLFMTILTVTWIV